MPAIKYSHPSLRFAWSLSEGAIFIKYWLPVIAYAALIYTLSSIPGKDMPAVVGAHETSLHITEYAIFAFLVSRALRTHNLGADYIKRTVLVFLIAFIYAISDEFHQAFVPNRDPSLYDLFFDAVGILITNIFYR